MKTKQNYFIVVVDEYGENRHYVPAEAIKASNNTTSPDDPYKEIVLEVAGILKQYNPDFGDDKICECGHTYYRHFDTYEGMALVGCKYCSCREFKLKK